MNKIKVSIIGGSGYVGGELIRLLLFHPHVELYQITSESHVGQMVSRLHPNLRKLTQLSFISINELKECDFIFSCLPHGQTYKHINHLITLAPKIIDLSADFRLKKAEDYNIWYGIDHPLKDLLKEFVYGIPELHREEIARAKYVSSAGCNATAVILALYPLYRNNLLDSELSVIEVKAGSSEAGNTISISSHHPERSNCVRSYKPTGHRHIAEMLQELSFGKNIKLHFSATAIDMVRGITATSHVFLKDNIQEKDLWNIYRKTYGNEPFIRIIKERDGNYRYPEAKLVIGTNYCDIGFEKDKHSSRAVIISVIDNLMKGAAGQAVQAFNIMNNIDEKVALEFPGLHPI